MQVKTQRLIAKTLFVAGLFALQISYSQAQSKTKDTSKIYTTVEKSATFPGGVSAFGKYLGSNIRYPSEARSKNIQGRVILSFIVETDGALTDIKAVNSADPLLSKEAVRVMSGSPLWEPGTQNGNPVRQQYYVPVSFTLPAK
jgi:periplasmic protein TonB